MVPLRQRKVLSRQVHHHRVQLDSLHRQAAARRQEGRQTAAAEADDQRRAAVAALRPRRQRRACMPTRSRVERVRRAGCGGIGLQIA